MRVKSFKESTILSLEHRLNEFMGSIDAKYHLIDVKYAVVHESVNVSAEYTGATPNAYFTALVLYRTTK